MRSQHSGGPCVVLGSLLGGKSYVQSSVCSLLMSNLMHLCLKRESGRVPVVGIQLMVGLEQLYIWHLSLTTPT